LAAKGIDEGRQRGGPEEDARGARRTYPFFRYQLLSEKYKTGDYFGLPPSVSPTVIVIMYQAPTLKPFEIILFQVFTST
jgi:hypothetical protein